MHDRRPSERPPGDDVADRRDLAERKEGGEEDEIQKLYARVARKKQTMQAGARTVRMETVKESPAENGSQRCIEGRAKNRTGRWRSPGP